LWFGRLVVAGSILSAIALRRPLHCWRFVGLGFLASCPVCFCCAVVGRVFVRRFRPVRFGLFAVTIKLSELVFYLGWLVGLSGLWLAVLVVSGWFQSGVVGLAGLVSFPLSGSAVRRVFPVRAKRHPHAQLASQRDCPPFRKVLPIV